MIHMLDTCLPFEVERRKEFAPIKNKTGWTQSKAQENSSKRMVQNCKIVEPQNCGTVKLQHYKNIKVQNYKAKNKL